MYTEKIQFRVLPEHITLLSNANVGWDDGEFGAPAIDCKRPYGNSNVLWDIARLLAIPADGKVSEDEDPQDWDIYEAYSQATLDRMNKLHEETRIALQIFLSMGVMQTGLYETEKYKRKWTRV
jgi:hypothetical protein